MKKQIKDMKFRVGSEQDSIAIQKLLFMMGCVWLSGGTTIRHTKENHLYAKATKISCGASRIIFNASFYEETTLEELKSIVGEWLYSDILGCQVSTPSGTAFVVGVKLLECREVVLVLQEDFGLKFPACISDSIGFFTNDYNDDTLPFEDFLKFIRSDNVIENGKEIQMIKINETYVIGSDPNNIILMESRINGNTG